MKTGVVGRSGKKYEDSLARFLPRLKSIYGEARHFGYSSTEVEILVMNDIWSHYMPQKVQSYINGYEAALVDELYASHLVYGAYIGKVFVGNQQRLPSYYENYKLTAVEFGALEGLGHYWLKTGKVWFA